MILLTLSRGKGKETVRLQLPASPAEIGEAFASLDRISRDTTATAILDVSGNVPVLYRCLYDVDVEDSEQFQKLQKLAERTEALSPTKAAIFSGALDAEHIWNLDGSLTVADRLDEYMLVNNVSSDSELGIYLVNKGITPFPDRFKPYINYARVGAEYAEALRNLEQVNWKVDCILSHCGPSSAVRKIDPSYGSDQLTNFLDMVNQRCQFIYWFFGHYHDNRIIDDRYILQWEQISGLEL